MWQKTAGQLWGWYKGSRTDLTTPLGLFHVGAFPPLSIQPQELDIMGTLQNYLCFTLNFTAAWYFNTSGFDATPNRAVTGLGATPIRQVKLFLGSLPVVFLMTFF